MTLKIFSILKRKQQNVLYMFFFDMLFFTVLIVIGRLINAFLPKNPADLSNVLARYGINTPLLLIILLAYYAGIVLLHSVCKLFILQNVGGLEGKIIKYDLKRFFGMNSIIFIVLLGIFIGYSSLAFVLFKDAFFIVVTSIFLALFGLLSYVFISISQSLFMQGLSIKDILKKAYNATCHQGKRYVGYLGIIVVALILMWVSFGILETAPFRLLVTILAISSLIFMYATIVWNRVGFWMLTKKL